MKVWRICRSKYAQSALSGEGSRLAAARWNSIGTPMVYTSLSLSLAVLEVFVHMDMSDEPEDLVSIKVKLPVDEMWFEGAKAKTLSRLPKDWKRENHLELKKMGDEWVRSRESLVLPVPSAVVDEEWNVLLNPGHPDAAKIMVESVKPFWFDPRMIKVRG